MLLDHGVHGWVLPLLELTDSVELEEDLRERLDQEFGLDVTVGDEIGRSELKSGKPVVGYACRSAGLIGMRSGDYQWMASERAMSLMTHKTQRRWLLLAIDASS